MKLALCAVRDLAVQAYISLFPVKHTGQAVRTFSDECRKTDGNPLASHPEDYELHQIGTYDEESGLINQEAGTIVLLRGKDAIIQQ